MRLVGISNPLSEKETFDLRLKTLEASRNLIKEGSLRIFRKNKEIL